MCPFHQIGIAWFLGARFDLVVDEVKSGNFLPKKDGVSSVVTSVASQMGGHNEL